MNRIVFMLRTGGDFSFYDAELLAYHIRRNWKSSEKLEIICMYDKTNKVFELKNGLKIIPMFNVSWQGWWTKMNLFDTNMDKYRPFLYMDLDTAIVDDISSLFSLINPDHFVTLEDFYKQGRLASGLMWMPKQNEKVQKVWREWLLKDPKAHMQNFKGDQDFIGHVTQADAYFQQLTNQIYTYKPKGGRLKELPPNASIVCFHGQPRIHKAGEECQWVWNYVRRKAVKQTEISVIIPYKTDRGWLQEAIDSVGEEAQVVLAQGDGNWATNFNDHLRKADGRFIKVLHEDDKMPEGALQEMVKAIQEQDVDFVHGNAMELTEATGGERLWIPPILVPTFADLMARNTIHGASTLYRREIFDKIGGFDETLSNSEEYEFHLRCLYKGMKVGYVPRVTGFYRRHPGQKIRNITSHEVRNECEKIKERFRNER